MTNATPVFSKMLAWVGISVLILAGCHAQGQVPADTHPPSVQALPGNTGEATLPQEEVDDGYTRARFGSSVEVKPQVFVGITDIRTYVSTHSDPSNPFAYQFEVSIRNKSGQAFDASLLSALPFDIELGRQVGEYDFGSPDIDLKRIPWYSNNPWVAKGKTYTFMLGVSTTLELDKLSLEVSALGTEEFYFVK